MLEPISTTAAMAIAKIAFDKFVEGGAGELGRKLTESMTQKVEKLAQVVIGKLRGNAEALKEIEAVEKGLVEDTKNLAQHLDVLWENYPEFGKQVQQLTKEINIELTQIEDNSSRTQIKGNFAMNQKNLHNSTGIQANIDRPNSPIFLGGKHNHGK
jgi:uncharacterized protein YoxC